MRNVCLLGASGSIGRQTLDVMAKYPNDFSLVSFSVGKQTRKISSIIKKHSSVKYVSMIEKSKVSYYQKKYPKIRFYSGDEGLLKVICPECDMVVNALVGFAGLRPSVFSLENNKILCLANKESLVVGGELINKLLDEGHGKLYPIDSEHSALLKCLMVNDKDVDKLMLTASGGAFRKLTRDELKTVTPEQALAHPTWKMGKKITIDCATMINKAFEVIEAHYLYRYPYEKIGIMLHDESMIHSYIVYKDGSLRLDIDKPDMRKPIKFAMFETNIPFDTVVAHSLDEFPSYHFHEFTFARYPIVKLAELVIKEKGTYGAVFNAANEVAVYAFLNHEIPFLMIEEIVAKLMNEHKNTKHPSLDLLVETDKKTRKNALNLINEWRNRYATGA